MLILFVVTKPDRLAPGFAHKNDRKDWKKTFKFAQT